MANGGITTTLAFILLAGSKSHVFSSFFKIFFLVVTFGLWHGLATLPVLLAICGPNSSPPPMADTEKNTNHDDFIEDHVEDSENCEKNAPETAQKIEDMPPDNIA